MYDFLLLQAAQEGSPYSFFIMMALLMAVFYFFMIRPQAKKQKTQQDFSENLKKGDEVVTASGIIGRINKLEDNVVTLDLGGKTLVRMTRSAISKEMTDSHLGPKDAEK